MAWPETTNRHTEPSDTWDIMNEVWVSTGSNSQLLASGGGRYRQQLVVVSEDGKIYYGD